jgi:hypothetical protein
LYFRIKWYTNNSIIDRDIENCDKLLYGGFDYYDVGTKKGLGKVSLEGFHNGIRHYKELFKIRRNNNRDNLIEILK